MPSRETELYKDKVEVSLDGRQIFYLFFGGAVIVGIVFVLGVLVGRRVEARGHVDRAHTTAAADPLAALDRLEGNGGMAFRGEGAVAPVEKAIDALEKQRKPDDKKDTKKTDAKVDDKKTDEKKVDEKKVDEKKVDVKVEDKKVDAKVEDKKPTDEKKKTDEKKAEPKADDKPVTKPDSAEAKAEPKKDEEKTRYTLQLSSFQDKAEAEAYLTKIKDQGYAAQITQAEVEGKGTFYRVRMGSYRSLDAATTAKSDFEKASSKSASIMKL